MTNASDRYKETQQNTLNLFEATHTLLETAAKHMDTAATAIEASDIEKRVEESTKATKILSSISMALYSEKLEQEKVIEELKNYYDSMTTLITRMNIKNDAASARAIAQSLKQMAGAWLELKQRTSLVQKDQDVKPQGAHEHLSVSA